MALITPSSYPITPSSEPPTIMAFAFALELSCPCCYRPGVAVCENFNPMDANVKLAGIRGVMAQANLNAYVVPMGDAHASEYVSIADKRIEWLTGFTGSAGTALVTADAAMLWTDGRYFVQAAQQLGSTWTLMRSSEPGVPTLEEWVATEQRAGRLASVGVDPALVSLSGAEEWDAKGCAPFSLVAQNLVDSIWGPKKPPRSSAALRPHGLALAGESVASKLARVGEAIVEGGPSQVGFSHF